MSDLYESLGLRKPNRLRWDAPTPGTRWDDLGVVEVRPGGSDEKVWATVRVEVCQMPAMFWRFTIDPSIVDVDAVTLSTGSGDLADYWPSVLLFATGMMTVKP